MAIRCSPPAQDPATQDIPVIFLTALDNARDEERGFQHGAADYIAKPIKPDVVLARVRSQLLAKSRANWLRDQNAVLEAEVARRMEENELIQTVSIRALAHLAETRDPETGNHILRTQGYVRLLAIKLRDHPRFAATLDEATSRCWPTRRRCTTSARSAFPIPSCRSPASSPPRSGPS
jgi:putative two-component system response regulator